MHKKLKYLIFALVLTASCGFSWQNAPKASAACTPATDYGTVTLTINAPSAATYRVWTRIMAPDTTNNSYSLEVDGGNCIVVGNSAITANTWTWVDYRDGNTNTKIDVPLAAGSHTLKLIGTEPSVAVDRVILTSDTACVPTGTGDNCANPADTTPPTVSVTAPANNANVSGSAVTVSANASDDTGVTRVEFYINGQLAYTDTTSTYGMTWNTSALVNGAYQITARAYDAAGNSTTSSVVTANVNNVVADTTKPTVNITAPLNGGSANGNTTFSATASDNVGVARVEFSVDGIIKNTDTASPYSTTIDTTTLTNGTHTFTATAYDAAGNNQAASATVTVSNTGNNPTGDVNGDSHVTIQDLAILVNNYGKQIGATLSQGDLNADGKVTIQDLAILIAHYGQ